MPPDGGSIFGKEGIAAGIVEVGMGVSSISMCRRPAEESALAVWGKEQ